MSGGLVSLRKLAFTIRVPLTELQKIASEAQRDWRSHYGHFSKIKRSGTARHIYPPKPRLKDIQRRLNRYVLETLDYGDNAHGSLRGCSPASNALPHAGARMVVTNDIKAFFPSVSSRRVYRMLRREQHFGRDVAGLITRLTTIEGRLPEGAPTSSFLANLVLVRALDGAMADDLAERSIVYTRYVDDLTFSGDNPLPFITISAKLLSRCGLKVHRPKRPVDALADSTHAKVEKPKLRATPSHRPQEVTGLLVNTPHRVTMPRADRDKVRAAIHHFRSSSSPADAQRELASIHSRIARVAKLHPGEGLRLKRYLEAALSADKRQSEAV